MYRLCFAALVLLCQYGCAGTVTVLHFIGSISYEIYLFHGIVIILVRDFLDINSLLSLLIIYVLTFFFSWLISKLSQSIKIKILEN